MTVLARTIQHIEAGRRVRVGDGEGARGVKVPLPHRSRILPPIDVQAMDEALLDPETGRGRLLPAKDVLSLGIDAVQGWMVLRARYQIVTTELVDWLRARIAGRFAIEVCAGMGDLGHHLGIPMTDSYIQTRMGGNYGDTMNAWGQALTSPPPDVARLDAEAAVAEYQPRVVVASWVTQKWHPGDEHGFEHGVEEIRIVRAKSVETYIVVGNRVVHGGKRIARLPHKEYAFPWLVSRGVDQTKNIVYVWGR
jgi:hypothetical protein